MSEPYALEFFKDCFEREYDRKDKIDSGDSFLVGLATALGSVGLYYMKLLPCCFKDASTVPGFWMTWFGVFAVLYCVTFIIGVFLILGTLKLRDVAWMANLNEIRGYISNLQAFYQLPNDAETAFDETIKADLQRFALEQYEQCGQVNRTHNQEKLWFQTRARLFLGFTVVWIMLSSPAVYFLQQADEHTQKVQVVAPVTVEQAK